MNEVSSQIANCRWGRRGILGSLALAFSDTETSLDASLAFDRVLSQAMNTDEV